MIKNFRSELRVVKNDILNSVDKADPKYYDIKESIIDDIFKGSDNIPGIRIDVNKDPLKLLPVLMRMSRMGYKIKKEMIDKLPENKKYHFKSINVFPSKSSNIPEYMDFDTVLVIRLLVGKDIKYHERRISKSSREIWDKIFNMDHKVFKKFENK